MMEYWGYIAKVEYDDSVGMLHGEVINALPYLAVRRSRGSSSRHWNRQ